MKLANVLTSVAAAGLVLAPVAASAGTKSAAAIPGLGSRTSAKVEKDRKAASTAIIAGLAAVAVIGGAIIIADDDDGVSGG